MIIYSVIAQDSMCIWYANLGLDLNDNPGITWHFIVKLPTACTYTKATVTASMIG